MSENKLTNEEIARVFIYTLTDPNTGIIKYVGATVNIKNRLERHWADPQRKLGEWIKSLKILGTKPILDVIETCSKENWDEREKYWISYYRQRCEIFNITNGGKGLSGFKMSENNKMDLILRNSKKLYSKNINSGKIEKYPSVIICANILGIKQSQIVRAIKTGSRCKNYLFSYSKHFIQSEKSKRYGVAIIATKGDKKLVFKSSNEAGKELGLCPGFIRQVLKKEYKQYKGYEFTYK